MRGCKSGSGGREQEAEREEAEDPGAEHEPAADAERGDLPPQLEHRQLGFEPSERGRTLSDLVDHRADAVSAGGHDSASRSPER